MNEDKKEKIIIYTDGSSSGNPGPGGWAAVILFHPHPASPLLRGRSKEGVFEIGGGEKMTTNNRMELTAVIKALDYFTNFKNFKFIIHTDAEYVLKGITQWARNWQKNGWRTKNRKPVLNQDLWRELIELDLKIKQSGNSIEWKLVPAHTGVVLNERCDKIAVGFSLGGHPDPFRGTLADYQKFLGHKIL